MKFTSILRPLIFITLLLGLASLLEAQAQTPAVVRITGVRFAYPLVERWIENYSKVKPDVQVIVEWRGQQDPSQYDILVEAYEQPEEIRKDREYVYIGRYAILPVANSTSAFAKAFVVKGLTTQAIKQIYFHDIFADNGKEVKTPPHTTYTRLQKAGSPMVFASYFKYEQKDIKGKGIAGSDDHLLKAVLRDTTGVSYLPTPLIYDKTSGAPQSGIAVLPVDLNGNDRVSEDEKIYDKWSNAIEKLSAANSKEVRNVPIEYIHLSVNQKTVNPEALSFIRWVVDNGLADLKDFGFLPPEASRLQKDKFNEFASRLDKNEKP